MNDDYGDGRVADMRRFLETIIYPLEQEIQERTDDLHFEFWTEAHQEFEGPEPSRGSFEWIVTAFLADHFALVTATAGYLVYVEHCKTAGGEQLSREAFPRYVSEAMSRIKDDWFRAILEKHAR